MEQRISRMQEVHQDFLEYGPVRFLIQATARVICAEPVVVVSRVQALPARLPLLLFD